MKPIILLYGGGIDSTTLLAHLSKHRRVYAMFFAYGQKAEALEREACKYFCERYHAEFVEVKLPISELADSAILNGGALADNPAINIVDGRNLTFITLASMFAAKVDVTEIAVGFHVEPVARPFPDASPEFLDAVNTMLPQAFVHKAQVVAPFKDMTRAEIFRYADSMDSEILAQAHTCYEDVPGGCGKCSHCLIKAELTE
ncbi:7-cyano-7-deazaguanine synthase [Achromobacter phage Motura]|uniref:7-cyano-7-deazaguanine synthase n=1 Tax=Achromobacter phage Motura TaxID=2591403 RepID=A0A514CSI1_9CAUD|nr:QueC-like queuosine biosynthesis [Achromobacter phage Motura]QDH83432.1 7-cyano-7-deazaguanine synthase [Achromobacter phage Motura]